MTQHHANSLIPVDAVIHYRTDKHTDFAMCHALNLSPQAVHVLLEQPLNQHDTITFMVRPEGSGQQPYYVSGEVKKRGLQDGGWLHEVAASSNRPWSEMFQYDVLCSARDSVPTEAEENTSPRGSKRTWISPWANPIAWSLEQTSHAHSAA